MISEPIISVGILRQKKIKFSLFGDFTTQGLTKEFSGNFTVEAYQDKIILESKGKKEEFGKELILHPSFPSTEYFSIKDVVIGVQFHWERREKESFRGSLKLLLDGDAVYAINLVPIEEYLKSVISSEMNAKSSPNLLKAHAVISRSWLLAQIEKSKKLKKSGMQYESYIETDTERIRWYDREDHTLFDVCADDHCQRYQGITKIHTEQAKSAIDTTRGLVLSYRNEVCDARFSKSCGGISESFEKVWEPVYYPYLIPVVDYKYEPDNFSTDFTNEKNVRKWIEGSPHAFCNTTEKKILAQVLLEYDQETSDFFRWHVEYSQDELSALIKNRSGIDFGRILDLIPIERGASARLIKMKIVGEKRTLIIGKELEIRRTLSPSHLYSSAIIIDKYDIVEGVPGRFVIRGAGWGHGVGLCQIGAAVMAEQGYKFDEILLHYYRNAELKKIYE